MRGPGPDIDRAGEQVLARWREPHRHYHTLAHLTAVLDVVDQHADLADRPDVVRLAAWFHDAVYDPRAAGDANERRQRRAGRERAHRARGAGAHGRRRCAGWCCSPPGTRWHRATADGALLCDADLAVLAAPPAGYERYAAAIRREYAHVPEPAFRAGRAAVLTGLLALPALFRLPPLARPMGGARPGQRAPRAGHAQPRASGRTRAARCFGRRRSGGAEQPDQLPARHHLGTEPHRRREPVGRNVVVVPVEAAPGRAERLGEGVQLGVRDVADQV